MKMLSKHKGVKILTVLQRYSLLQKYNLNEFWKSKGCNYISLFLKGLLSLLKILGLKHYMKKHLVGNRKTSCMLQLIYFTNKTTKINFYSKLQFSKNYFYLRSCQEKANLHVEIISIDQIQIPYSALLTFPFIFLFKYAYVCKIVRIAFSD